MAAAVDRGVTGLTVNAGGDVTDVRLVDSRLIAELAQGVTRSWLMPGTRDQTTVRNQTPGFAGGMAALSSNGTLAIVPGTDQAQTASVLKLRVVLLRL